MARLRSGKRLATVRRDRPPIVRRNLFLKKPKKIPPTQPQEAPKSTLPGAQKNLYIQRICEHHKRAVADSTLE